MRRVLLVVCTAGCFAPSAPAGTPCEPRLDNCPSGQRCTLRSTGAACLPDGTPDEIDAAVPDASVELELTAEVAECIDPAAPDPKRCRELNGQDQLAVDGLDSTTMAPWHGFVRFTGAELSGRTISRVVLRMVVGDVMNGPGPSSGEVFEASEFSLASLSAESPEIIGGVLAPSQGAVEPLQVVEWLLPPTVVKPNGTVHLGVLPTANDGTSYFNTSGAMPPVLIVTVN